MEKIDQARGSNKSNLSLLERLEYTFNKKN